MAALNRAEPSTGLLVTILTVVVGGSAGTALTLAALAGWSAIAHAELPLLWWASRALGFLAYLALWLAMVSGVLISAGGFGGRISRKWTMDLHQEWTLAAVLATVLHIVVVVVNPEAGITPWAAVIPFAADRMTGSMAVGTFATLLLGLIAASSWLRTRVPYGAWRALHALSFGAMLLALVHSIAAGTDTTSIGAATLYIATSVSLTGLIALRVLLAFAGQRRPAPQPSRS